MLRWGFIVFCLLAAVTSCVVPFPHYAFVYRPLETEHQAKYAAWQAKMNVWKDALRKETEDRRGSAIPVLTRGKDGDLGVWLIGNVAARMDVLEAREAADEYYEMHVVPLGPPHGRARTTIIILAGASVLLTMLFLLAAALAMLRGGILFGLLLGFSIGSLIAAPHSVLWGWLVLHLSAMDFVLMAGVVIACGLLCGLFLGIASRIVLAMTAKKQPPAVEARP